MAGSDETIVKLDVMIAGQDKVVSTLAAIGLAMENLSKSGSSAIESLNKAVQNVVESNDSAVKRGKGSIKTLVDSMKDATTTIKNDVEKGELSVLGVVSNTSKRWQREYEARYTEAFNASKSLNVRTLKMYAEHGVKLDAQDKLRLAKYKEVLSDRVKTELSASANSARIFAEDNANAKMLGDANRKLADIEVENYKRSLAALNEKAGRQEAYRKTFQADTLAAGQRSIAVVKLETSASLEATKLSEKFASDKLKFQQQIESALVQNALQGLEQRAKAEEVYVKTRQARSLEAGKLNLSNVKTETEAALSAAKASEKFSADKLKFQQQIENALLQNALQGMDQKSKTEEAYIKARQVKSLEAGKLNINSIKADVAATQAAEAEKQAAILKTIQMQVRAATNNATEMYQRYSPANQIVGSLKNVPQEIKLATSKEIDYEGMSSALGPMKGLLYDAKITRELDREMQRLIPRTKEVSLGLSGLGRNLFDVHSLARGLASGFNLLWLTWGSMTPLLAGAAISMSFTKSLKVGADVLENMADIQSLAGATTAEISTMTGEMIKLGQSTAYGPTQTSEALKILSLAGLDAQKALSGLKPTLDFALAGGVSTEKAAETLVAVATAYGYSAEQMSYVGDVIAKTAAISMTSVEKMSESFRVASTVAQQFGVSITDSALILASLSQIGITGQAAGTAMRNYYNYMISGSGPAKKAMQELGLTAMTSAGVAKDAITLTVETLSALSKKGFQAQQDLMQAMTTERGAKVLAATFAMARQGLADLEPAQLRHIEYLKRTGQGAAANYLEYQAMGTELKRLKAAIEDAPGFTAIAAAAKALSPESQWKAIKASMETDLLVAFQSMNDMLFITGTRIREVFNSKEFQDGLSTMVRMVASVVEKLVDLVSWLGKNSDEIRTWATGVGTAVATLVTLTTAYKMFIATTVASSGALVTWATTAVASIRAVSVALTTTPAGWAILAASVIAGGLAYAAFSETATSELSKVQQKEAELKAANKLRDSAFMKSIEDSIQGVKDRIEAMKTGAKVEMIQSERAIADLNKRAVAEGRLTIAILENQRARIAFDMPASQAQDARDSIDEQIRLVNKATNARIAGYEASITELKKYSRELSALEVVQKKHGDDEVTAEGKKGAAAKAAKAKVDEMAAALKLYSDLTDKSSGFTATWTEDVNKLWLAYKAGEKTAEEHTAAVAQLLTQQPVIIAFTKQEADALAEINKQRDDAAKKASEAATKAEEALQKAKDELKAMKESIDGHTKLKSVIAAETLERLKLARAMVIGAEDTTDIDRQIDAQEELVGILEDQEGLDAAAKAAARADNVWAATAKSINKDLTQSFQKAFESGMNAFDGLWASIKKTLRTQILRVSFKPISDGISNIGKELTGETTGDNKLGVAGNLAGIYNTMSAGFTKLSAGIASTAGDIGSYLASTGSETLQTIGGAIGRNTAAIGSAAASAAGVAAGLAAREFIGKDYSMGAAMDNFQKAGIAISSFVPVIGPVLGTLVGIGSGLLNRAFGMGSTEVLAQGTRGTFSSSGFAGENYANMKQGGGWFRSDKNWTETSALSPEVQSGWSQAFNQVKASISSMAAVLGKSSSSLDNYTKSINIAAGATEADITKLFGTIADEMALRIAPAVMSFAKNGESASVTLSRLTSSLSTANLWFDRIGKTLLPVSLYSGDAASKLADLFGGVDGLANATSSYYNSIFTEEERMAKTTLDIAKSMALLNSAVPTTLSGFRDLVNSADILTESGRNTYVTLMALAPEFASMLKYRDDAAAAAAKAAEEKAAELAAAEEELFTKRKTAKDQLDILLGAETARSIALRDETDGATKAILAQVHAQEDLKTASEDAATAMSSAVTEIESTLSSLLSTITSAREGVSSSVSQILGLSARNIADIALDVQSAKPGSAAGLSAEYDAAMAALSGAKVGLNTATAAVSQASAKLPDLKAKKDTTEATRNLAQGSYDRVAGVASTNLTAYTALSSKLPTAINALDTFKQFTEEYGYSLSFLKSEAQRYSLYYRNSFEEIKTRYDAVSVELMRSFYDERINLWDAVASYSDYKLASKELEGIGTTLVAANTAASDAKTIYDNAVAALGAATDDAAKSTAYGNVAKAQAAVTSAETAATAASKAYSAAIVEFNINAIKSTATLSKLREEVVSYYESQKALSEAMLTSAQNLRSAASTMQFGQLSSSAQLKQLQTDFDKNYVMALSTSGGEKVSYADKLTSALPSLAEALKATATNRQDWITATAKLAAQSGIIASSLETTAPKDYAAESLSVLNTIDSTLALLQSDTEMLQLAISNGADKTVAALAKLSTGVAFEAFAKGGYHSGGLRLVGEEGPELEATGPSRIWTADETAAMLSGEYDDDVAEPLDLLSNMSRPLVFQSKVTQPSAYRSIATQPLTFQPLAPRISPSQRADFQPLALQPSGSQPSGLQSDISIDEVVKELKALNEQVINLRAEVRATATNTNVLAKLAKREEVEGKLIRTDSAQPLEVTLQ